MNLKLQLKHNKTSQSGKIKRANNTFETEKIISHTASGFSDFACAL